MDEASSGRWVGELELDVQSGRELRREATQGYSRKERAGREAVFTEECDSSACV